LSRTLALVVEYDGSGYHGFQRQSSARTVAGELERVLASLFKHPVRLVAAGRTDAGVHATGQVVSLETTCELPLPRIALAASALLRESRIAVLRAVERQPGFSARHHALSRAYRYKILNRPAPSPLLRGRALHVRAALDLDAMRVTAAALTGKHDFAAFSAGPPHERGTVREIRQIDIERADQLLEIAIVADSFLHQMARIIVGTLLEIGRGRRDVADVERVLASKSRASAGFAAPAHALYLERVEYDPPV
jgi:tRNA pseudouridine38-40 synthase